MMTGAQLVKVRKEALTACMICPLCNKLLRDATTISVCLHTFCRKCIYEKLSDEDVDSCPECHINLGCVPVEKLRPDHNLQDIRAKIFPCKRRKIRIPEVVPSVSPPVKRKERSLSSLVVSTPKVPVHSVLTGRRTKSVTRKINIRGSSIEESIKKEAASEDYHESSSSHEVLNKNIQDKVQTSSSGKPPQEHVPIKEVGKDAQMWKGNIDLWKPLNCLVEAANRTKPSKLCPQDSPSGKLEPLDVPDYDLHMPKTKNKDQPHKSNSQDNKNRANPAPGPVKRKRLLAADRNNNMSDGLSSSAQSMIDIMRAKENRRNCPIWFSLVASRDQREIALPQIPAGYLRVKDGNLPVSFIQKYLMKKLGLTSEAEVEITCQGHSVLPTLQLQNVLDRWLQTSASSKRFSASVGSSAKEFVMVLSYSRKIQQPT